MIKNFNLFNDDLLNWYEQHQRILPWRSNEPSPYFVLISEVMLQQTTVPTVIPYFHKFIDLWPTITDLANASLDEVFHLWQGLGYYSRARNLHKCAQAIRDTHAGVIPDTVETLITLPGIGPYTAAAIAAIAFDRPVVPVDGNVIRVFARLANIQTPLPTLKEEIWTKTSKMQPTRPGEFAQALMDLGSSICRPRNPICESCPVQYHCKAVAPATLPKRAAKGIKPTRFGIIYWIKDKTGRVLLQKRPDKGLLAGMMGFPTSEWTETRQSVALGVQVGKVVRHTFTHFHLELTVSEVPGKGGEGLWVVPEDLHHYALPTLMKKVAQAAGEFSKAAIGAKERR